MPGRIDTKLLVVFSGSWEYELFIFLFLLLCFFPIIICNVHILLWLSLKIKKINSSDFFFLSSVFRIRQTWFKLCSSTALLSNALGPKLIDRFEPQFPYL